MNENSLYIQSAGVCLAVKGEKSVLEKLQYFTFLKEYIPGIELISLENGGKVNFVLQVLSGSNKIFELVDSTTANFFLNEDTLNLHDLVTVIEYCLERSRQEKGIFCFHGSAISKLGKTVLLMGQVSGLGKTTLALKLCLDYGFSLVGDEKILINSIGNVVGGITKVSYNKKVLDNSLEFDLQKNTEDFINIDRESGELSVIIQPMIFSYASNFSTEKWSDQKTSFHIYEELTRKIRGVSRRINSYTIPLPSLDSEELSRARSEFSNKLSKKLPAWSLWGNLDQACEFIDEICRS